METNKAALPTGTVIEDTIMEERAGVFPVIAVTQDGILTSTSTAVHFNAMSSQPPTNEITEFAISTQTAHRNHTPPLSLLFPVSQKQERHSSNLYIIFLHTHPKPTIRTVVRPHTPLWILSFFEKTILSTQTQTMCGHTTHQKGSVPQYRYRPACIHTLSNHELPGFCMAFWLVSPRTSWWNCCKHIG
jgi:hypothetical protein